jgi:predicted GNAT superfamily acetyltransferase
MRDQEIVGLYEAYQSIYSNVNEEVEQLDELSDRTVSNALNARIDATGAAADRAYKHRNPEAMRAAETAADKEASMRSAVARRRKRKGLKEEVETWVNSLVEEGYDLSDYTWDDMVEIYVNEAITSEKGKAKAAKMIAKRSTASGRAKPGQGDTVALIRHISRSEREGLGGTPATRSTSGSNRPKSYSGTGGTGNKAARRAGLTPTREKPNAWKEQVETWVNSLVEEGYDLSDYTWDDMYEMYMNLDEKAPQTIKLPATNPLLMPNAGRARLHKPKKVTEETNLFNYLLEYLVAEGYADTNKAAINIMSHMSEEWKQSIVEEVLKEGRTTNLRALGRESQQRKADKERGKPKTQDQIDRSLSLGRYAPSQYNYEKGPDGKWRNMGRKDGEKD